MNYYNQYIPGGYPAVQNFQQPQIQPVQNPVPSQTQPQKTITESNVIWAKGIEGAKEINALPSIPVIILDSETDGVMYIKTCDSAWKPSLKIFDYKERVPKTVVSPSNPDYVLKKDFEAFREEVKAYLQDKREVKKNESTISTTDETIPYGIRERI